jgi:hypothetical protein
VPYPTSVARGLLGVIVGLAVVAVGTWGARPVRAQAPAPGTAAAEPLPAYLAELERTRRLPPETASLEKLRERLAAAEESLARGDARAAASGLYELVESPRWSPWQDTVPFQQAELTLGRALLRGGATLSAERYLVRVLRRGPDKTYFVPAHRAMVDLALETRQVARVRDLLAGVSGGGRLPPDSAAEQAYLDGRARYQAGDLENAANRLAQVPRTSRLYAGAAYFRGLIAARLGHFDKARNAFCEILPGKNQGTSNAVTDAVSGMVSGETLAFTIDGRYFQLQDLARLALGRIAHERDRYDEAYYFYFSVPEDSDRLAEALFEAAWSMYQKGEVRAARAFVDSFDRTFPDSPLRPEVALLRANIALRSCAFDGARAEAAALVSTYEPLQKRVAAAAADPALARVLTRRLLTRRPDQPATGDADGRLLALLKLDDRFGALAALLRETEADEAESRQALSRWRSLQALATGENLQRPASSPEAAQLLEEVEALVPQALEDPELAPRAETLLNEVTFLAYPPSGRGPYAAEEAAARRLVDDLAALRQRTAAAAQQVAMTSFVELDARLRGLFRQTRLVHIDAVVGRKKRLEIEIANLRAGRLDAALYAKMKTEGTLGDDEEYWPFEGEYWADEYENYR